MLFVQVLLDNFQMRGEKQNIFRCILARANLQEWTMRPKFHETWLQIQDTFPKHRLESHTEFDRYEVCYAQRLFSDQDIFLFRTSPPTKGLYHLIHFTRSRRAQAAAKYEPCPDQKKNIFTIRGYKHSPSHPLPLHTSPGVNCRFHHGFVDEDSMSWLKRSLTCIIAANARSSNIYQLISHSSGLFAEQFANIYIKIKILRYVCCSFDTFDLFISLDLRACLSVFSPHPL